MYSPTYAALKSNLEKELDLEDETFITSLEFLNYFNEAVDMVEASIHTIYEDYFKTKANIAFVNGTQSYVFPSDIYAQKIRRLNYDNGSLKYNIRKIVRIDDTMWVQSGDPYTFDILNDSTTGLKLYFYPTPNETSSTNVTMYYIRNAKRFTTDNDVCDIPEFTAVIVQYVRWKCLAKEGHPDTQMALGDLERMKQDMVDTLTARVPDENNEIEKDLSFYYDFDDIIQGGY